MLAENLTGRWQTTHYMSKGLWTPADSNAINSCVQKSGLIPLVDTWNCMWWPILLNLAEPVNPPTYSLGFNTMRVRTSARLLRYIWSHLLPPFELTAVQPMDSEGSTRSPALIYQPTKACADHVMWKWHLATQTEHGQLCSLWLRLPIEKELRKRCPPTFGHILYYCSTCSNMFFFVFVWRSSAVAIPKKKKTSSLVSWMDLSGGGLLEIITHDIQIFKLQFSREVHSWHPFFKQNKNKTIKYCLVELFNHITINDRSSQQGRLSEDWRRSIQKNLSINHDFSWAFHWCWLGLIFNYLCLQAVM